MIIIPACYNIVNPDRITKKAFRQFDLKACATAPELATCPAMICLPAPDVTALSTTHPYNIISSKLPAFQQRRGSIAKLLPESV